MFTVDRRTRFEGDEVALEPSDFVEQIVPPLLDAHGFDAGRAAFRLGLAPMTLDVDGERITFSGERDRLYVRLGGADAELVVALDRAAFSDLMQDVASTFGIQMVGRADVRSGTLDEFVAWEPALRCLLDGRPVYQPGTIEFQDRAGAPLDLHRSFTLDDAPDEIGQFLSEAGFLHVEGMFTEAEMAAVGDELEAAAADAERDDGASWWACTTEGEWYPARILGFNRKSATLRELLRSDRFATIGTLTGDRFVQRNPDHGDSAEGLRKKVGVVEGISDVSWHKDCAMGGHSRRCCGLTVGLSVTGGGPENGELGAVAGSHRANVAPLGIEGLDLPRIPLPTRTGDVTVHCSCTLHMSRPPVSAERRVVYTGFGLAPRPEDHRAELDPEEVRRARHALNEQTQSQRQGLSAKTASFDL